MSQHNKLWVSLVMAVAAFLRSYSGIDLGVDNATATAIVGAIWSALVWVVPNKKPKESKEGKRE